MTIEIPIEGKHYAVICDTGAFSSVIGEDKLKQISEEKIAQIQPWYGSASGYESRGINIKGQTTLRLTINKTDIETKWLVSGQSNMDILMGVENLDLLQAKIDFSTGKVTLEGEELEFSIKKKDRKEGKIMLLKEEIIPARSMKIIQGKLLGPGIIGKKVYIGPYDKDPNLWIANGLGKIQQEGSYRMVDVGVMNASYKDQIIKNGKIYATWEAIKDEATKVDPAMIDKDNISQITQNQNSEIQRHQIPKKANIDNDIEAIISKVDMDLDPNQLIELAKTIKAYQDIFRTDLIDPGSAKHLLKQRIDVGDNKPIRQKPHRNSYNERLIIRKELDNMLQSGVIRPSFSPWAAPVVLVTKKDGKPRFCIDFRKLNAITKRDVYPLPLVDDITDQIGKATFRSTLDLTKGFWQIPIEESDKEKTAFITYEGLFEWNTMPMGLTNSPSAFQRNMERVLSGLNWKICLVFMDDIIIFSKDFNQHLRDLQEIFTRLQTFGLKIRLDKCHFCRKDLPYLGVIISGENLMMNPAKVASILNMGIPQTVTQVKAFLGLTSYYRRFIEDYAYLAKPLYEITKPTKKFEWNEKTQMAYDELKRRVTEEPILKLPNLELPFILQTDASGIAIGAVLSQNFNGEEHPVYYASRVLKDAKLRYSTVEKECLAIVHWVKYFRHYLIGRKFKIITDQRALKWLLELKDPSSRLTRWSLRIQEYKFDIEHKPGRLHTNADALTRMQCAYQKIDGEPTMPNENFVYPVTGKEDNNFHDKYTQQYKQVLAIRDEQLKDDQIHSMMDYLEGGILPTEEGKQKQIVALAGQMSIDEFG